MSKMNAYLALRVWDRCLWSAMAVVMLLILVDKLTGGVL